MFLRLYFLLLLPNLFLLPIFFLPPVSPPSFGFPPTSEPLRSSAELLQSPSELFSNDQGSVYDFFPFASVEPFAASYPCASSSYGDLSHRRFSPYQNPMSPINCSSLHPNPLIDDNLYIPFP